MSLGIPELPSRLHKLAGDLEEGARALRSVAADVEEAGPEKLPVATHLELTWRERLWLVPGETRIGVEELAEALGRSKSWIYKRTQASAKDEMLPFRRLHGELCFRVGEIRTYLHQQEDIVAALPLEKTEAEARIIGRIEPEAA